MRLADVVVADIEDAAVVRFNRGVEFHSSVRETHPSSLAASMHLGLTTDRGQSTAGWYD
jgi:hypothetical protein